VQALGAPNTNSKLNFNSKLGTFTNYPFHTQGITNIQQKSHPINYQNQIENIFSSNFLPFHLPGITINFLIIFFIKATLVFRMAPHMCRGTLCHSTGTAIFFFGTCAMAPAPQYSHVAHVPALTIL
jgi:hypothetical protein